MSIQLDSFSRFKDTQPIITDAPVPGGRVETFGLWKPPKFLTMPLDPQNDVMRIQVDARRAGRPDLIADDIYGSPSYYWVLITFNQPDRILGWPQNGLVIQAPVAQVVLGNL
jgi:hypothetical protein